MLLAGFCTSVALLKCFHVFVNTKLLQAFMHFLKYLKAFQVPFLIVLCLCIATDMSFLLDFRQGAQGATKVLSDSLGLVVRNDSPG